MGCGTRLSQRHPTPGCCCWHYSTCLCNFDKFCSKAIGSNAPVGKMLRCTLTTSGLHRSDGLMATRIDESSSTVLDPHRTTKTAHGKIELPPLQKNHGSVSILELASRAFWAILPTPLSDTMKLVESPTGPNGNSSAQLGLFPFFLWKIKVCKGSVHCWDRAFSLSSGATLAIRTRPRGPPEV